MVSSPGVQAQMSPLELFRRAAEYENGSGGTKKDMDAAIRYYREATRQGHTPSMVRLGFLLQEGLGVKQDLPEAFELFTKAARAGDPFGQLLLAASYEYGNGIGKNLVKARYWLLQAAAAGIQLAQYKLGVMLLKAEGGKRKKAAARRWFSKAASGKNPDIAARAADIRRKLDKELFSPDNSGTALLAAAAFLFIVGAVKGGGGGTAGASGGTPDFGLGGMPSSHQQQCSPVPVSSSGMIVNNSALSRPGSYASVQLVCH